MLSLAKMQRQINVKFLVLLEDACLCSQFSLAHPDFFS
jgi:hypothetical protein